MSIDRSKSVPAGIGMSGLKGKRNRYLRSQFWKLSDTNRDKVQKLAERHYIACHGLKVPTDPDFFYEVITDLRKGEFQ